MQITIRYFANVREALGLGSETLILPSEIKTIGQLRQFLQTRGDVWQETLSEPKAMRMALNQTICDMATPLSDMAEVAFFPPVTGG